MISPSSPVPNSTIAVVSTTWESALKHSEADSTVTEAFPGTELATEEELQYLDSVREADLIAHWNTEVSRVAGGIVNVLHGWTWLDYRKSCKVCGSDCFARDPQGTIRHPNCEVDS